MSLFDSDKERGRFYLLPGMGGHALRRKHKIMLASALIVGLVISALLAVALYLVSRQSR